MQERAGTLVVFVPGMGRPSEMSSFSHELGVEAQKKGHDFLRVDTFDHAHAGLRSIFEKAVSANIEVSKHILQSKPKSVFLVGHSQGGLTASLMIEALKTLHPGVDFKLITVFSPLNKQEHDDAFDKFRRYTGFRKHVVVSEGFSGTINAHAEILHSLDPLVTRKSFYLPSDLQSLKELMQKTHFLHDVSLRHSVVSHVLEFVDQLSFQKRNRKLKKVF